MEVNSNDEQRAGGTCLPGAALVGLGWRLFTHQQVPKVSGGLASCFPLLVQSIRWDGDRPGAL